MRKVVISVLCVFVFAACANKDKEEHICFMSVPVDGGAVEFIRNIQMNGTNDKGCFSDNLELQVDSVDYEKEKFYCAWREKNVLNDFLWMDFDVHWFSQTNKVAYLEGRTLLSEDMLRIFKTCLYESLGRATYMGSDITDAIRNSWTVAEHALFDTMSNNFCAWKLPNGYVIIDYTNLQTAEDKAMLMMFIVDNVNYCSHIL